MVYLVIDKYEEYAAGYFTNHLDAHKYAAIHNNYDFDVETLYNLGDTADLSNVSVKFRWNIAFYYDVTGEWHECHDAVDSESKLYSCYTGDIEKNLITLTGSEASPIKLHFIINTEIYDWNLAVGIANDLLADLLKRGSGKILTRNIRRMNDELAEPIKERQRLKEEEELREKELAELARLKEKYENHE